MKALLLKGLVCSAEAGLGLSSSSFWSGALIPSRTTESAGSGLRRYDSLYRYGL